MEQGRKKRIDVVGFPMDLGADRRGVDMGPSALRIAGILTRLKALGYEVFDHGDIIINHPANQKIVDPKLKYLDEIVKTSELLADKVEKILNAGNFPLCLGGDHTIALGSIAGISKHCRDNNIELGVIWIDAHADMNTNETTPSGNIHGMPLASSLGMGHKKLANLLGFSPKVKPENCALIGIRSLDALERKSMKKLDMSVYTMTDIDKMGVHRAISQVLKNLKKKVGHLHVSFDVDSIDPRVAPGVGTPVFGGLTYRETHLIMEAIAECGCMSSLEVTEVNPILDEKNRSAEVAVDIVASSMGQRIF